MTAQENVLLVMCHPGNARVLQAAVSELGMNGVAVATQTELDAAMSQDESPPRSALVDVSGFGNAVWSMCDRLHEHGVPFVVLSAAQNPEASGRSLRHGASSYLQKPVAKSALLQLVQSLGER